MLYILPATLERSCSYYVLRNTHVSMCLCYVTIFMKKKLTCFVELSFAICPRTNGKEESTGPVEQKDDDSKKEEIDDHTNTEVRHEKALLFF